MWQHYQILIARLIIFVTCLCDVKGVRRRWHKEGSSSLRDGSPSVCLLQVCGWYPDKLHTYQVRITPGDFDAAITTVCEVYYSLFAAKYASKYSGNTPHFTVHIMFMIMSNDYTYYCYFNSCAISTSLSWIGHKRQFPGCQEALVMDGNMKNRRDVCMTREAGLPGGQCVVGQLGRILGCPRDPLDCL